MSYPMKVKRKNLKAANIKIREETDKVVYSCFRKKIEEPSKKILKLVSKNKKKKEMDDLANLTESFKFSG